jgi:hypothetical protein
MKKYIFLLISVFTLSISLSAQKEKEKHKDRNHNNWWHNSGWGGERVYGEGPTVKETRAIKDFTGFESGISADIYLKQSKEHRVTLEGQKNILALVKIEKKPDGTIRIGFEKGYSINYKEPLKINIESPIYEVMGMSGSGNVVANGGISGKSLDIYISGSGDFDLTNLNYTEMDISVSGSGDMDLSGSAENINFSVSGSGDIKAQDLKAKSVRCRVSGSGDINCNASDSLDASISGSGDIRYRGKPASLKSRVSGSGDVDPLD